MEHVTEVRLRKYRASGLFLALPVLLRIPYVKALIICIFLNNIGLFRWPFWKSWCYPGLQTNRNLRIGKGIVDDHPPMKIMYLYSNTCHFETVKVVIIFIKIVLEWCRDLTELEVCRCPKWTRRRRRNCRSNRWPMFNIMTSIHKIKLWIINNFSKWCKWLRWEWCFWGEEMESVRRGLFDESTLNGEVCAGSVLTAGWF